MDSSVQNDVYLEVLTAIVQRFLNLMGEPALRFARRIYGLHVEDDGTVSRFQGDGMVVVQGLVIEYMTLIGFEAVHLSERAIDPTIRNNPKVKLPSLFK
jgi:hypothetical protein